MTVSAASFSVASTYPALPGLRRPGTLVSASATGRQRTVRSSMSAAARPTCHSSIRRPRPWRDAVWASSSGSATTTRSARPAAALTASSGPMPAGSPAVISRTFRVMSTCRLKKDFDVGLVTHLAQHAVDFLVGTLLYDQVACLGPQRFFGAVRRALAFEHDQMPTVAGLERLADFAGLQTVTDRLESLPVGALGKPVHQSADVGGALVVREFARQFGELRAILDLRMQVLDQPSSIVRGNQLRRLDHDMARLPLVDDDFAARTPVVDPDQHQAAVAQDRFGDFAGFHVADTIGKLARHGVEIAPAHFTAVQCVGRVGEIHGGLGEVHAVDDLLPNFVDPLLGLAQVGGRCRW